MRENSPLDLVKAVYADLKDPLLASAFFWLAWKAGNSVNQTVNLTEMGRALMVSSPKAKRLAEALQGQKFIKILDGSTVTEPQRNRNRGVPKYMITICYDLFIKKTEPERNRNATVTRPDPPESPCDVGEVIKLPRRNRAEKVKKEATQPKSAAVVAAYSKAWEAVYRSPPVDNAKLRSIACKLVDALGAETAPQVAAFYVTHRSSWYVQKGHALEWCLADAQKLRAEFLAGVQVTSTMARDADKNSTIEQVFNSYMNKTRDKETTMEAEAF